MSPGVPIGYNIRPMFCLDKTFVFSALSLSHNCLLRFQILRGARHTYITHTHTPHQMQFTCLNCAVNRPTSQSHQPHPRRCFMSGHIARSRRTKKGAQQKRSLHTATNLSTKTTNTHTPPCHHYDPLRRVAGGGRRFVSYGCVFV